MSICHFLQPDGSVASSLLFGQVQSNWVMQCVVLTGPSVVEDGDDVLIRPNKAAGKVNVPHGYLQGKPISFQHFFNIFQSFENLLSTVRKRLYIVHISSLRKHNSSKPCLTLQTQDVSTDYLQKRSREDVPIGDNLKAEDDNPLLRSIDILGVDGESEVP